MVGSQIASQGCLSSQADFRRFYIPDSYARVRVSPQTQKKFDGFDIHQIFNIVDCEI